MGMSDGLFRKSALDKLSSPEQLDVMMQVTSPTGWIALGGSALILLFVVVWSVVGEIGIRVDGQGILIRGASVLDVTSAAEGRLTDVLVKPGDTVKEGQPLARLSQPELVLKIENTREQIRALESQTKESGARGSSLIAQYQAQARELREKLATQQRLVAKGLLTKTTLLSTKQQLASVEQQIAQSESSTSEEGNRVDNLRRDLKELEAKLAGNTEVASPYTGTRPRDRRGEGLARGGGRPAHDPRAPRRSDGDGPVRPRGRRQEGAARHGGARVAVDREDRGIRLHGRQGAVRVELPGLARGPPPDAPQRYARADAHGQERPDRDRRLARPGPGDAERIPVVVLEGPADPDLQRDARDGLRRRREPQADLVRPAAREEVARGLKRVSAEPVVAAEPEPEKPKPKPPNRRAHCPTVLQMEAVECGAAALSIILQYHGRIVPLEELRVECGVSRDGSKASERPEGRAQVRPRREGLQVRPRGPLPAQALPVILFWNFNHFLVLEGFGKKRQGLPERPGPGAARHHDGRARRLVSRASSSTFEPGPDFKKGGHKPSMVGALQAASRGLGDRAPFVFFCGVALVIPGLVVPTFVRVFIDEYLVSGRSGLLKPLLIGMAANRRSSR
jgi:pyruvate/2-oxoglutarate dehydrogenase complex dihydrolipoamide acyltransferase (E2) component